MVGQFLPASPHPGWVLLETGRQNLSIDVQEDLFVPTLGKPVTKEKGQSPGSRKWIPRCRELALADPLALGLRGTEDCASHERPQGFALCPCPLVTWSSLPPLTLLHSLIHLPEPSHCMTVLGESPSIHTRQKGNPNQRSKSSQIYCGERGSFEGLVTGAWVTLATASSERSHSKGDDSQKWHPWSSRPSLQTAPQQLCAASVTSEGGLRTHSCGRRGSRVVFLSHHLL